MVACTVCPYHLETKHFRCRAGHGTFWAGGLGRALSTTGILINGGSSTEDDEPANDCMFVILCAIDQQGYDFSRVLTVVWHVYVTVPFVRLLFFVFGVHYSQREISPSHDERLSNVKCTGTVEGAYSHTYTCDRTSVTLPPPSIYFLELFFLIGTSTQKISAIYLASGFSQMPHACVLYSQ